MVHPFWNMVYRKQDAVDDRAMHASGKHDECLYNKFISNHRYSPTNCVIFHCCSMPFLAALFIGRRMRTASLPGAPRHGHQSATTQLIRKHTMSLPVTATNQHQFSCHYVQIILVDCRTHVKRSLTRPNCCSQWHSRPYCMQASCISHYHNA